MRKALALSIVVTVLGLTAYFFKPSEEKCIQKAREEFRHKISYTVASAPKEVNKDLFAQTLETDFLQKLEVKDKFLYRNIYQLAGGTKIKIGWAALGWVTVDLDNQATLKALPNSFRYLKMDNSFIFVSNIISTSLP